MNSFDPFLSRLGTIHDPRRAEGKLYQLPYILLFSILAIVTGANSYRGIRTFIKVQLKRLNKAFKIGWKRPPAHTAIRYILQGLNPADGTNPPEAQSGRPCAWNRPKNCTVIVGRSTTVIPQIVGRDGEFSRPRRRRVDPPVDRG